MPRSLSGAQSTELQQGTIRPVHLAELDFSGGFVRVASTPFSIAFDSNGDLTDETFLGIGGLGSVSAVEETGDGKTTKITLTLSGVDQANVALALGEPFRGRPATLWRGWLDPDYALIGAPVVRFAGIMSAMPYSIEGRAQSTVSVVVVDRFARWNAPLDSPRWDNVDHQTRRPGDKGLEFIPELVAGKEVVWGRG